MVIATAGIDLSVGSVFSLVAMVSATFLSHGHGLAVAVVAGLLTGLAFGLFNGFCVAVLKLAPFVVTLVSLSVGASLAFVVTGGNSVPVANPELANIYYGRVLGIPNHFFIPVVLVLLAQGLLSFMVFGRWIFAVGSNAKAAELVGIPTQRVTMAAYLTSGFCAALASILSLSYLANAEVTSGNGLELQAIAAVVIGGASLFGGRGSAIGALLGALIITAIQNTVNLLGINTFWQGTVTGAVILIAVLADRITSTVRTCDSGEPSHTKRAIADPPTWTRSPTARLPRRNRKTSDAHQTIVAHRTRRHSSAYSVLAACRVPLAATPRRGHFPASRPRQTVAYFAPPWASPTGRGQLRDGSRPRPSSSG